MRQVDRPELQYILAMAMRRVTPGIRKMLIDPRREQRSQAEAIVGGIMADELRRFEVLTSAPAAHESLFTQPLARMLGEEVEPGEVRAE